MKKLLLIFLIPIYIFAFEVQKPKTYDNEDISGWYMSEKLDGIRAYWDGKNLYTKNKNIIYAPKWFTKDFPSFELDGELFTKRDDFETIQSIVLDEIPSKSWSKITYNIFEVPNADGNFLSRLDLAKKYFSDKSLNHVKLIPQMKCKDTKHLEKFLKKIIYLKGEGVIVKDGSKTYHTGRTSSSLKVKTAQDMEGKIIAYNYKLDNKTVKSLVIKLSNGVVFNLGNGLSKEQRVNPPKIGEIITFKYYGLTKNKKPKFASFLRIRKSE